MSLQPPSTPADPSPDLVLAVDLGASKVEAALVGGDAAIAPGTRFRAPTGREKTSDELAEAVRTVIRSALGARPTGATVVAAGIGSAGPVEVGEGRVSPLSLPAWRSFPLAALVAEAAGLQAMLRLDGLCITLAEVWAGALAGRRNAMGMVVSTGIGGGILADGRLISGRTGNAGHLGQLLLEPGATLEQLAAGPNILAWAREQGWNGSSGEELAASAAAGEDVAVAAIDRCVAYVARGIASVAALLDLEAVAVGGGFSRVSPDFVERVAAEVLRIAPLDHLRELRVVRAALGDDAPLIGAAALVYRAELLPEA